MPALAQQMAGQYAAAGAAAPLIQRSPAQRRTGGARSAMGMADPMTGEAQQREDGFLRRSMRGIRATVRRRKYDRVVNELTGLVAQTNIALSAVDQQSLTDMETRYVQALAQGGEAEREEAKAQLDALRNIQRLMEGQGQDISERVLEREVVTQEEASELLDYLRGVAGSLSVLSDFKTDMGSLFDEFADTILDERVSGEYRAELARSIAEEASRSDLFDGGAAAARLAEIAQATEFNSETAKAAVEAIRTMQEKVDIASMVNDLAQSALSDDTNEEETRQALASIATTLDRIDGFEREQTQLAKLSHRDDLASAEAQEDMRMALTELSSRTTEANMLYNLKQINDKFDDAVVDEEELATALEASGLAERFAESVKDMNLGGGGLGMDLIKSVLLSSGLPFTQEAAQIMAVLEGAAGGIGGALAALFVGGKVAGGAFKGLKATGRGIGKAGQWAWRNTAGRVAAGTAGAAAGTAAAGAAPKPTPPVEKKPGRLQRVVQSARNVGGGRVGAAVKAVTAASAALTAGSLMAGTQTPAPVSPAQAQPAPKPTPPVEPKQPTPEAGRPSKVTTAARTTMNAAKRVPVAGPLIAAGLGAAEIASAESDTQRREATAGMIGGLGGAAAGAALGAAVGSVVPVAGTAVGAVVGAILGITGGIGGDILGRWVAGEISSPLDAIPDAAKTTPQKEMAAIDAMLQLPVEELSEGDRTVLVERRAVLEQWILTGERPASDRVEGASTRRRRQRAEGRKRAREAAAAQADTRIAEGMAEPAAVSPDETTGMGETPAQPMGPSARRRASRMRHRATAGTATVEPYMPTPATREEMPVVPTPAIMEMNAANIVMANQQMQQREEQSEAAQRRNRTFRTPPNAARSNLAPRTAVDDFGLALVSKMVFS